MKNKIVLMIWLAWISIYGQYHHICRHDHRHDHRHRYNVDSNIYQSSAKLSDHLFHYSACQLK